MSNCTRPNSAVCKTCHAEFSITGKGRIPQFCRSCKREGWYRAKRVTTLAWRTCVICAGAFPDKKHSRGDLSWRQACVRCESTCAVKQCAGCLEVLPLDSFTLRAQSRDGRSPSCRRCVSAYKRSLVERDPLYERRKMLKRFYGISLEQYEALLAGQDGGCAVCHEEPPSGQVLYVDHDHGCCPGKRSCGTCVRGLLCQNCNFGIGQFKDNPLLLLQAVEYLKAQ